jgi:nitroimidazol reductase NimA-like FMN-containing flavoprotein (pyridoxamine 5'-phosphate oxidase superfamily)
MVSENYEDVRSYNLDDDTLEQLLHEQTELNFMWGTKDHWPVGVFMSFVWRDGSFWVTLTTQRARMRAIERDPRVSVAVSSAGTSLGRQKSATAKGRVIIHDDDETRAWFYPALASRVMPDIAPVRRAFVALLDSEHRVVLEVVPEKWITFDVSKMQADTAIAMAKVAMPEGAVRVAEQFGIDLEEFTRKAISIMGIDKPRSSTGARKRVTEALGRIWPL